ncbi:response regulator [Larkinella insperata]|uniref:Response regulator n=1 Tax=Larkinella insperata TaxID=332158 RepID=A0ABW3Q0R1_9BACT
MLDQLRISASPGAIEQDALPQILVVEDNETLLAFLANRLGTHYRLLLASNGARAWELAQQHLPDLVISDVMMPLMDGFELTQRLKTSSVTDHIAVILLTDKAAPKSRLDGLGHGADDYIAKPFQLDELTLRVSMSRKTLDRKVQSLTQLAPNELIRNYQLLRGAELLGSGQPISQVAYQVGFESPSHFSYAFRELYALTPSEFARRY